MSLYLYKIIKGCLDKEDDGRMSEPTSNLSSSINLS